MTRKLYLKYQFKKHLPFLGALLLLSFVLYEISFYIFKTYRAFFNSDAAIANILAEEMVLSGSFFPSHWWYVNNDLWIFYKQLLVIPWVLAGKNGYFAHAFTVFEVSIFMIVFIYLFLRSLMLSRASSIMGSVVVCIGYSPMYLRELYGEAAYTWYFLFMIAFMFIFRKLSPHVISKSTQIKAFIFFMMLLYLLVLANPVRFFVYYVAPFFGALALSIYFARDSLKTFQYALKRVLSVKRLVIFAFACLVMGLAAMAHFNLLESLHLAGGANNAGLVSLEILPVHAAHAFLGLLNFIGAEWNEGVRAASIEGVVSLLKFALYPFVLIIPALHIKHAFYQMSSTERFFVLFSYVGFSIIFVLYATTGLHEHAWSARNNIRYISPFLMMILVCNVIMWRFFSLFMKLILSLSLAMALSLSWSYVSPKEWRGLLDERIALVEELKSRGLHFGFAEYWDSHIYTVFSDGEVDIRPIQIDEKGVSLVKWLSSDRWYQKDSTDGRVFFMVEPKDINDLYLGIKNLNMPDPIEQFEYGKYHIFVFEKNPLYVKKSKAEARKKKAYNDGSIIYIQRCRLESVKISVVSPIYGCKECLFELYDRLVKTLSQITENFEIILVNDACPQASWERIVMLCAKDSRVKGVNLSRNFGQHYAITAGLDYAKGDWVVVMDCDLQDRPEEIIKLYNKALDGYDIVFGRRAQRQDSFFKQLGSKAFNKVLEYFTETKHDNSIANFGIYAQKVVETINRYREHSRDFLLFAKMVGFKKTEIDIDHASRAYGQSSYNLSKLIRLAIDSIVSHSNKPLRLSIQLGFFIALASLVYAGWLVIRYFFYHTPAEGWTSLMVSMFFMFGLLFAIIGITGLYIGKIFDEVKRRPLYIIQETINI